MRYGGFLIRGVVLLIISGWSHGKVIFLDDTQSISYDLIIITNESLKPAFSQFQDFKWTTGVSTEIITTEWIYENFPGVDTQEKIRNFIGYAKENLGARYILLGGDVGIIPARILYVPMTGTADDFIPGDFYYMCLDGNFNADGDTLFGEPNDEVDYIPDISLTRLPVNTTEDVYNYLRKEITYLLKPGDYLERVVLIGSDITSPGTGAGFCRSVEDSFPDYFDKIEFYEEGTDQNNNKNEIIDTLNHGAGFVYGNLHAQSFDRMLLNFSPRIPLTNFDVDNRLTNSNSPGFYDIVTCHIGGFDVDALAEHFIRDSVGAIGVFVTTRLNYPAITIRLNKYFYSSLFHGNLKKLGDLEREVRTHFAYNASYFINYRYIDFSYEMFGDPTLELWTGMPDSLYVQCQDSVSATARFFHVEVMDSSGSPLNHAMVVVYLPGIFMAYDSTDTRGEVDIPIFPGSAGSLSVFVKKDGYTNFLKYIQIIPGPNSIALLSSATEPENIEAGDTVLLSLTLLNNGSSSPGNITLKASSNDQQVSLIDSVESISNFPPGDTINLSNAFSLTVDTSIPNGYPVDIYITGIAPDGDTILMDSVALMIYNSSIIPLFFSDSAAGDTLVLNFALQNRGGVDANGVEVIVDEGRYTRLIFRDTLHNIPASSLVETGYRFRILPDSNFDSIINFSIRNRGRVRSYSFSISNTGVVDSLASRPENGGIELIWAPVPQAAFYAIYRSENLRNFELAGITRFHTWRCSDSTGHFYRIAAVDSSGYRGEESPYIEAHPTLPVKTGWPVYVEGGTYTSPIVYDFDPAYPGKEVFVASFPYGYIYLYHADGTIAEGWPIFLDGEIWASPAAADLDGDSTPEIVVAIRSSNTVYAFNADGSLVEGWPVHTSRGTFYTPAIGDIDGDGSPEVVINDQSSNLYVFRADGTGFDDSTGVFMNVSSWWKAGSPILFDYNGDGKLDIGIGTRVDGEQRFIVVSFTHDTLLEIPVSGRMVSAPVVGDFVPDSAGDEILLNDNGEVKLFSHNGYLLPGWPLDGFLTAVAADVNFDGKLDVIGTTENGAVIYNNEGQLMALLNIFGNDEYLKIPVVADVNNDRAAEILFEGLISARLYAMKSNGAMDERFPFNLKESPGYSVPFIEDIDNDGFLDIVVGSTFDSLWVLESPTPFDETRALWRTEKYDIARTGWVRYIPTNKEEIPVKKRNLRLTPAVTTGTLSFLPPLSLKGNLTISFYDVAGRLVQKFQFSRVHPVKLRLDSRLSNGVYFYVITVSEHKTEGKILLLR